MPHPVSAALRDDDARANNPPNSIASAQAGIARRRIN
jgi:hypothetical protein